jgi:hypothetical protein
MEVPQYYAFIEASLASATPMFGRGVLPLVGRTK